MAINHNTLGQLIESLELEGEATAVADALNAGRTAPDPTTPAVTWGSLTINHGVAAVLGMRAVLKALIAATAEPAAGAFVLLGEQLAGGGVRVGLPSVRATLEAYRAGLPEEAEPLLDMLLNEATEPLLGEPVTAADVTKARLLAESDAAFGAWEVQERRALNDDITAERDRLTESLNAIAAWDGEGDPPAAWSAE